MFTGVLGMVGVMLHGFVVLFSVLGMSVNGSTGLDGTTDVLHGGLLVSLLHGHLGVSEVLLEGVVVLVGSMNVLFHSAVVLGTVFSALLHHVVSLLGVLDVVSHGLVVGSGSVHVLLGSVMVVLSVLEVLSEGMNVVLSVVLVNLHLVVVLFGMVVVLLGGVLVTVLLEVGGGNDGGRGSDDKGEGKGDLGEHLIVSNRVYYYSDL